LLILGLDPSTTSTGYGLVRVRRRQLTCDGSGCFRPASSATFAERLQTLYDALNDLLTTHRPDAVALESSFYGRDADAASKLGEARGVLRLALVQAGFDAALYSPAEVKKSVCGSGQASKEAVQDMVTRLLRLDEPPRSLDASDALAVAICHHHRGGGGPSAAEAPSRKPEVEALLRRVAHR
jgi:crossover junction endodeoxyribonuclease RuvC